jgi:hypothetical protein
MGSSRRWVGVAAVWLLGVTCGFAVLWRHAAARGSDTRAPASWPAQTRLTRAADRATLLVFVHPRCSCSRATLAELSKLLARVPGRAEASVVMARPDGVPAERGELDELARRAGARTVEDPGAVEAARFGAETSGATLLYDAAGRLAFAGGLTSMRGHEGDSFGQERIVALLSDGAPDRTDSPVFGCPIHDRSETKEDR